MRIPIFPLPIYLIAVIFTQTAFAQEDCGTVSDNKDRLACYDAKLGAGDAVINEKSGVSIDKKIIGKWGYPVEYIEFYPDHTFRFINKRDNSNIGGTWAVANNSIIMAENGVVTENMVAAFEGDKLMFDGKLISRVEGISKLDEAKFIADEAASKVAEGLNIPRGVKLSVQEFFDSQGKFPSVGNNPDANSAYDLPPENSIGGNYVSGVAVLDSGVIRITYKNIGGDPSANGHTILLTPRVHNNKIVEWDCSGGTMPDIYLPASCR